MSDVELKYPWIKGPEFLRYDELEWLIDDVQISTSPVAEAEMKKRALRVEQVSVKPLVNPAAYSIWMKLLRTTAWFLRFCHNLRNRDGRSTGPLSVKALGEAELYSFGSNGLRETFFQLK